MVGSSPVRPRVQSAVAAARLARTRVHAYLSTSYARAEGPGSDALHAFNNASNMRLEAGATCEPCPLCPTNPTAHRSAIAVAVAQRKAGYAGRSFPSHLPAVLRKSNPPLPDAEIRNKA